jgi:hypothetical protein
MSSPDFTTFVATLVPSHRAWITANPTPSGNQFLDHYVGDPLHPDGLLWQYEAWRAEHGYFRVRPWNGTELLGRTPTADIPSPGLVLPWITRAAPPAPAPAGPAFADSFLAEGTTTTALQTHFGVGNTNALGAAVSTHWNAVGNFPTPWGDSEIEDQVTALYSIRFWGFMKWASILRNRLLGIPVFAIPIAYDADGVPLSDIEFMDVANRWHTVWHRTLFGVGTAACGQVTSQSTGNPFAPDSTTYGQFCGYIGAFETTCGDFMKFHRALLNTYDNWRQRAAMPKVERWKPPDLHFHPHPQIPETQVSVDGLVVSEDPGVQLSEIKSVVRHFNTLESMAEYADGQLHAAGHGAPESEDISDVFTNNYSPRFMAWHRWIDYLWEVRQPRFNSLRPVASDGTDYRGVLTIVRPAGPPDQVQPNNALTGLDTQGRGSLWVKYNIRPESWGRPVTLTLTAEVFRNSGDLSPVAALTVTQPAVTVSSAQQGADSAAIEIPFTALDAGEGAFARQTLPGGAVGFKNGRIRIKGRLVPVGNIPGTTAIGDPNDQFDHEEHIDIILVKETRAPVVSVILNKSAFSVDEVTVNAAGSNQSPFVNSAFVVVQDPPEPPPAIGTSSIFADPARTAVAGIFADLSVKPTVDVVDEMGNVVNWFTVVPTDVYEEDPSLPDNVSQRVLFRHLILFNDVAVFSSLLPNAGDVRYARLRISARDRSGNAIQNEFSPPIKLFRDANPYMIDVQNENPHWLSVDTRVFSVKHTELKFGHRVSTSGSPSQYIKDVIGQFNAGTQNFDAIPADAGQVPLELMPSVGGENVYNFALARVRMRTQAPVADVRAFFRLFTTAVSNLSFNPTNYPTSSGASPIALLGRTTPGAEIVSISFFADPRVETRDTMPGATSMTSQNDAANVQTFPITPVAGETVRYFGAHLDINSDTPRYPATPSGDGPFPAAQCVSIRNIIRGQHQCMVAEVFYAGDPTELNATPATSDNLAQRNLMIIESANPGHQATHTVQHSFDIVLPDRRERDRVREELSRQRLARLQGQSQEDASGGRAAEVQEFGELSAESFASVVPLGASVPRHPSFDELVFFWNNLPGDSTVEVYLPSLDVDYVMLLRNLRRSPRTVLPIDEHRLTLKVQGVTYLPIPNVGQERVAGVLTVTLPDGIKAGEVYWFDVLQMRAPMGTILGAFRLTIPVSKAAHLYAREARLLEVFTERLKLTPPDSRWHAILGEQVGYFRARATGLAVETADERAQEPQDGKGNRVRVILERIKVLDFHGPLVHGSGEASLIARVTSTNAGGIGSSTRLPSTGTYPILDRPEGYVIDVNREIFRGTVVDNLAVEIYSAEPEEADRTRYYRRAFKGKPETWLGSYRPGDEKRDPENVGDWQLSYRIEEV